MTESEQTLGPVSIGPSLEVQAAETRLEQIAPMVDITTSAVVISDNVAAFDFEPAANRILRLKRSIGRGIYDIGRELNKVKAALPHGEFQRFLRDTRVDIDIRAAQRLMAIANAPDGERLAILGVSKATTLLAAIATPEHRLALMADHELGQTSVRELRELVNPIKPQQEVVAESASAVAGASLRPDCIRDLSAPLSTQVKSDTEPANGVSVATSTAERGMIIVQCEYRPGIRGATTTILENPDLIADAGEVVESVATGTEELAAASAVPTESELSDVVPLSGGLGARDFDHPARLNSITALTNASVTFDAGSLKTATDIWTAGFRVLQRRKGLSGKRRTQIESIYRDVVGQLRRADIDCKNSALHPTEYPNCSRERALNAKAELPCPSK